MWEVEVGTPLPSLPPENSPSANFVAAAPSSPSVPCFLSLTRGSHLPVTAAARELELGYAVLGCVRAQSWAAKSDRAGPVAD